MRILFSGESLYPPESGGDISALTLLKELAKNRNYKVEAIFTGKKDEIDEYKGIKFYRKGTVFSSFPSWAKRYFLNKKWFKVLDEHLKKNKYDWIITQAVLSPASVITAKKNDMKVMLFIRGYENFCISHFRDSGTIKKHNCWKCASWKYKIQYPFFKEVIKWHKKALKQADIIVANSKFVKKVAGNYDVKVDDVIYPVIELKNYKTVRKKAEYITLITPTKRKGVDIFLKIADGLPNKKFLVVGRGEMDNELKKRNNIKCVYWTNDMKKIYSRTKILLVPSIWLEPFGRVVVEAMCNDIPCIVSNIGGLPEAVGNAGIIISDIFNIQKWTGAIKKMEDEKNYQMYSKKSKEQAKKFDYKIEYKKFDNILNKSK
jgi:glycosyltransferase involved in cell wall biosynthesis